MVNFGLLTAEINPVVFGHPCKFQRVSRLGSVTAQQSSSGRQPNLAALNRGCHLCLAGRPSRWALAHILAANSLYNISVVGISQAQELQVTKPVSSQFLVYHAECSQFRRESNVSSAELLAIQCVTTLKNADRRRSAHRSS